MINGGAECVVIDFILLLDSTTFEETIFSSNEFLCLRFIAKHQLSDDDDDNDGGENDDVEDDDDLQYTILNAFKNALTTT